LDEPLMIINLKWPVGGEHRPTRSP
jgi:hypothetical protein